MRRFRHSVFGFIAASFLALFITTGAQAASDKPKLTLYTAFIPGFMGGEEPDPGILVEMVRLAAEKTGYAVVEKKVPWARAMKLAMESENALIAGFSRLPARERNYTWIVRQVEVDSAFIAIGREINSYDEARKLSAVGVHRATSHEVDLEERGFENIRSFSNMERSIKFLELGRIEAWFGAVNEFSRRCQCLGKEIRDRIVIGTPVHIEDIWLAGPKSLAPEIVEDLNYATRQLIDEGHRARLLKKYFGRE